MLPNFAQADMFLWALAALWFLLYWIFGGVFFALIAFLHFGRMRKARFSCLYTLVCVLSAYGAALTGIKWAQEGISQCDRTAITSDVGFLTEFVSTFACGFIGLFGALLVWFAACVLGGFLVVALSRKKRNQTEK